MRKAALAMCALICMSLSTKAKTISFAHGGLGFQLAFVASPDTDPVNAAFDMGVMGDIAFSLGRFGEAHYKPGFGVWFGGGSERIWWYSTAAGETVRIEESWLAREVHIDFADLAYYFPIPQHIIVRPYAGLGPMIAIEHIAYEHTYYDWSDTDVRMGLNLFGGADFRIKSRMYAFCELRGRFSRWDLFKLKGGMHFILGSR